MKLKNFGGNVSIEPKDYFEPRGEREVLDILERHRGRQIRVMGRLHSWSEAPKTSDVLLNLKNLDSVQITEGGTHVSVGGGCQIKRLISELDKNGLALPSQGLITEQTIAGAISTGTHGSGSHSLAHFPEEVTVATYDPDSGTPIIRTISEGHELQAARCSLGCLGVILSIKLPCVSQYRIEQQFRFMDGIDAVIQAEEQYPLQQFFLLPHAWTYLVQLRKTTSMSRSWTARLFHVYWFVTIDVGLHLVVLMLTRLLRSRSLIRSFYKRAVPLTVIRNWRVADKSQHMLTMEHELFRHVEIEVFVTRSKLAEMLSFTRGLIEFSDGDSDAFEKRWGAELERVGLSPTLEKLLGSYTHHYPICVRKVLPDSTLISMASGNDQPYYAVSFISYQQVDELDAFFQFAQFVARATAKLFSARPHWGKLCPIDSELAEGLYPKMAEFREICEAWDASGVFRNTWASERIFPTRSAVHAE